MAPRRYNDVVTEVSTRLAHGAPLDAAALLGFFGRRAVPGIEQVDGGRYRRSMRLAGGPAVIELRPGGGRFEARMWLARDDDRAEAVARCRAMLDLDADPTAIVAALGDDPVVGGLVRATPGLRLPGHADAHELAIRAVLGQQVSLAAAATLAGRLVAAYGEPLERPLGSVTHVFPSAAALAAADPEALAMPRSRARALLGLATALAERRLVLAPGVDPAAAQRRLLELNGIGPWTAAYVAMRGLAGRDAFPAADLGIRRALERLGRGGDPRSATALAERWRPFRAYAAQHLWATLV